MYSALKQVSLGKAYAGRRAHLIRGLLRETAREPDLLMDAISQRIRGLSPTKGITRIGLHVHLEQVNNWDNRVELGSTLDRWGRPELQVYWRVGDQDDRAASALARHFASDAVSAGWNLGVVESDFGAVSRKDALYTDNSHPSGTTRMSSTPSTGVVDKWGKVWDVDGLWMAGSSTFPSSGFANPTLTIAAQACIVAESVATSGGK